MPDAQMGTHVEALAQEGATGIKTVRCTACRAEFSDAEIAGASACAKCGSTSVPMAINRDLTVKVNWHELRILCMWAANWAASKFPGQEGEKSLAKITALLEAQKPDQAWPPLTLFGEIQELADTLGTKAELHDGSGRVRTIEPIGKA